MHVVLTKIQKKLQSFFSVPFPVWIIGWVTFLKNTSSVVLVIFCPFYLADVLGVSMSALGLVEGFVEAISFFARILSGVLSDSIKKRKPLLLAGYGLSLLGRLFLSLASSTIGILFSRTFERLGNGIQASPRDALVSDYTDASNRGACFGLRNSLTVSGSVVGAVLAMWFMSWSHNNYQGLFWLTLIPSSLAIIMLGLYIKDAPNLDKKAKENPSFQWSDIAKDLKLLPPRFWKITLLGFCVMLSNFGIVFLTMHAKQAGLPLSLAPTVMIVQSLSTAIFAFPMGRLADSIGKERMLYMGIAVIILGNIGLSVVQSVGGIFLCIVFWGLQMGVIQNTLLSFVADITPISLRGTGFGTLHFFNGIATLVANAMMGFLWDAFSPSVAFFVNAVIGVCALFISPLLLPRASLLTKRKIF